MDFCSLRSPEAGNLQAATVPTTPAGKFLDTGAQSIVTLTVHSALDAVGLTAAFATALGNAGISCNVIAAYYHDHFSWGGKMKSHPLALPPATASTPTPQAATWRAPGVVLRFRFP
ncbi:ACT domain-containing protein [Pseudomonas sp. R1-6]